MTEALQDELDRLKQRREDLKTAITAKKREAARLQKKRSQALEQQLRSVRSRLSSSERKLRTRRLIVLGSLMEKEVPPADLIDKLDQVLDRDQDRALFGLPPRSPAGADRTVPPASAPLKGWRPGRLPDGSWGSLYMGCNPKALPLEIVGLTITVRTRSGTSWTPPLPRSLSAPPTASWSELEDSINERYVRTEAARSCPKGSDRLSAASGRKQPYLFSLPRSSHSRSVRTYSPSS